MISVSRSILKSFFPAGAKPTSAQFKTLIDSTLNYSEDKYLLGLKNFNPALIYVLGDTVVYNQIIYQAKNTTIPGAFNISDWEKIAGGVSGAVTYKGTWNAATNTPDLNTIAKVKGDYYVVSVEGNTVLNAPPNEVSDWNVGDWAIYNGTLWEKIDNSEAVTDANNVAGSGAAVYKGKVNTILEFKRLTSIDGSLDIAEGPDSVDLGLQFGDSGTSASRTWSAFKINQELADKEPANPNIQAHISDVTTNPHQVTKLQVGLGNVTDTKVNFSAIVDPSAGDDDIQGYSVGSTWINTADETEFTCMDASTGAAVWQQITANPNIQAHIANMSNPHNTTKAQVGLGNVENLKVNLSAIIAPGTGNDSTEGYSAGSTWINTLFDRQYTCVDNTAGAALWIEITPDPNIQLHIADMNNPHNTTKAQVGLSNVDNTADADKPVSTAQAAADAAVLSSANSYADSLVVGLLNDRGNYDASGNTFPATGGSGTGGAIKKGDLWTISVAGILGGQDVEVGDMIRALMNAPGQTASKWALTQNNIGYVAENSANKVTSLSGTSTNVEYPGAKLVYDELATKEPTIEGTDTITDFWSGAKTFRNLATDVRAVGLLGLSLVTNQVISASDTILQALGYLQKQISDVLTTLTAHIGNTANPHNVTKAQVGLANVQNTKVNLSASVNPTVSDDGTQGYAPGSSWINTTLKKEFVCVDSATGAAVWKETTIPAPIFGNDYDFFEVVLSTSTTSTSFQTYGQVPPVTVPPTRPLKISTGTLTGTYRIQWTCLASSNNMLGEYRLAEVSGPAVAVGQVIVMQGQNNNVRNSLVAFSNVVLNGTNKDYVIQFRAQSALLNTQTMYAGKLEIFRVK